MVIFGYNFDENSFLFKPDILYTSKKYLIIESTQIYFLKPLSLLIILLIYLFFLSLPIWIKLNLKELLYLLNISHIIVNNKKYMNEQGKHGFLHKHFYNFRWSRLLESICGKICHIFIQLFTKAVKIIKLFIFHNCF